MIAIVLLDFPWIEPFQLQPRSQNIELKLDRSALRVLHDEERDVT